MPNGHDETGATTAYRLWQAEQDIQVLKPIVYDTRGQVGLLAQSLAQQHSDMNDLKDSMKSLRQAVIGFAFAVAGSAVAFAFVSLH